MKLVELLARIVSLDSHQDDWIKGITQDSRQVHEHDLFLAYRGLRVDGRDFISQAVQHGAAAVVYDNQDGYVPKISSASRSIPILGIPDLEAKMGIIASRFYQHPSNTLKMIGVTGTNGKTSITQFIAQSLAHHGQRCAVIGTLGKGFLPHLQPNGYTTPDAILLQKDLAECRDQGAQSVAMEVSSHSLSQHRVDGVEFDVAVFTNLTRDHLDYHGTMAAYGAAKAKLFQFPSLKYAIYNGDDVFGRQLLNQPHQSAQPLVYSTHAQQPIAANAVIAEHIEALKQGFHITVRTPWGSGNFSTPLLGRFNVSNLLAVLTVLGTLEFSLQEILAILPRLQSVPGRMQSFGDSTQPTVIVDYAHTPDALLQVLSALKEHHPQQLWCVFGCGGDRDRGKRSEMGAIAERYSDKIIITNDNPRTESPEKIIADIQTGLSQPNQAMIEYDRAAAIQFAIENASPQDIILIAGKGHEPYQILATQTIPFNDAEQVIKSLSCRSKPF